MATRKLRPDHAGRKPDAEHLRSLLTYSPYSGLMFWKCGPRKGHHAGSRAHHAYLQVYIDGVNYYVHRLAWLYVTGEWPDGVIDHIDGNTTNNSFANLRPATHAENMRNQPLRKKNKWGRTGVRFHPDLGKWHARLMINYREINLGYFLTKEEAVAARESAEIKYFKEFRRQIVVSDRKKKAA